MRPTDSLIDDLARGRLRRRSAPELWDALHAPSATASPQRDDLGYTPLSALHDYWSGLPRVDGVGQTERIDPEDVRAALGYVMLLDVLDGGADFRYALYGSRIVNAAGFDMTGKRVNAVPTTDRIREFFLAGYMAVVRHRTPILTVHQAPDNIMIGAWHRLLLPIGRGAEVTRLLVGNVPVDPEGRLK